MHKSIDNKEIAMEFIKDNEDFLKDIWIKYGRTSLGKIYEDYLDEKSKIN